MTAKLIDVSSGIEISAPDTYGELLLAGPNIMLGYINNSAATAAAITVSDDGTRWWHTGDLARIDADHNLWLNGRIKDRIRGKDGESFGPEPIEAVLMQHVAIKEAVVVGVFKEALGYEVPCGFVVVASDSPCEAPTLNEIQAWANERLPVETHLIGGVRIMESIPKSAGWVAIIDRLGAIYPDADGYLLQGKNPQAFAFCLVGLLRHFTRLTKVDVLSLGINRVITVIPKTQLCRVCSMHVHAA